jgi:hypothetical protein
MEAITTILGNIGVICFLYAYFLLQKGKVAHTGLRYLGLNLAGAILVMISLLVDWNLPAFLLEAAWAIISIYGIYIHIYLPRRNRSS